MKVDAESEIGTRLWAAVGEGRREIHVERFDDADADSAQHHKHRHRHRHKRRTL